MDQLNLPYFQSPQHRADIKKTIITKLQQYLDLDLNRTLGNDPLWGTNEAHDQLKGAVKIARHRNLQHAINWFNSNRALFKRTDGRYYAKPSYSLSTLIRNDAKAILLSQMTDRKLITEQTQLAPSLINGDQYFLTYWTIQYQAQAGFKVVQKPFPFEMSRIIHGLMITHQIVNVAAGQYRLRSPEADRLMIQRKLTQFCDDHQNVLDELKVTTLFDPVFAHLQTPLANQIQPYPKRALIKVGDLVSGDVILEQYQQQLKYQAQPKFKLHLNDRIAKYYRLGHSDLLDGELYFTNDIITAIKHQLALKNTPMVFDGDHQFKVVLDQAGLVTDLIAVMPAKEVN